MTTNLPRRRFLGLTGGAALAGGLGAAGLSAASASAAVGRELAGPPLTIPGLQQWVAGGGAQYVVPGVTQTFRVIVRGADAEALRPVGDILKADLGKVLKRAIRVEVQETPAPAAGDVVLSLAAIPGLDSEGYELKVGPVLELRGARAGVFHGAQTIVQWLRQATTVPAGTARDWPKYAERGFLVANAARHYSMPWWQGQIVDMAYLKLNLLWVNVGYDTAPLSQIKEIAAFAAKYNINLVPLTNMPGHMNKLLANRPDLLVGWAYHMDISKDAAYEFARNDVIGPNLGEIATPYWHLGADEYITDFDRAGLPPRYDLFPQLGAKARQLFGSAAQPVDALTGFLNSMNQTVRAGGKQMRVWNDGLLNSITAPLNKNIIVEHWVSWPDRKTPRQLLDEGYLVHNSNGDFLYYDPQTPERPRRVPDARRLYNEFHPGWFNGANQVVDPNHPGLRGAKLHLWTLPADEREELQSDLLMDPFRSLAQVTWGSARPYATYDGGFSGLISTLGRAPMFPVGRHTLAPPNGATSVWPHRPATITFYDAIDPASIQLREGGIEAGTPGRTTYDAATKTATFTPFAPWTYSKTCAMSVSARTVSGEPVNAEWRFTVAKRPSLAYPRSLWNDEDGPAVERYTDGAPIELGVRFRVDRPGRVLGVRFYKAPGDSAVHTGSLWSSSGARLATATFSGESTQGWQEVRFAQPVQVAANTTYTASYYSPTGTYGYNHDFFAGRGIDNGVLHALPDTNGVFTYGQSVFPATTARNTNYWVDLVFQPDTYGVFNVSDVPVFGETEPTSLELGLRFSSQANGKVHGVRFFKGTHNTGTHVGSLWTTSGQKLASATFSNESAQGWQEVRFAQPVAMSAGTQYVVSYSSSGGFSTTDEGLATSRENGALLVNANPPAGIYALSAGTFPTLSYRNRNYFTDVVFSQD
ncbi:DUF4082 domain-containing protein [Kribbella deserti]|uniref:DUF4082 domain-containing protein n=1 Tax=Kribbella deserti TaxID=1926257 RepID=A0ABV6QQS0_9ACTN